MKQQSSEPDRSHQTWTEIWKIYMLKKIAKLKHSNTNVFKYANCDKITE